MKISIITVCYNSSKTIEKTLKSVKAQTYKDIEYIVIDGASSDNTMEIVKSYDSVVSQWVSEPDKGLYDAMNKGIKLATGDYIGIINADDTFNADDVIERIAEFLKQTDVDASIGDIVQHKEDGKIIRTYTAKTWQPHKLKIGFMPPHPAIFFKKELFEKLGYYSLDFKIAADYELLIRYFVKYKIKWKYSGINTHNMLIGGVSSSGWGSYKKVSEEIIKGLQMNDLKFSEFKIKSRIVWKIFDYLKIH